MSEERKQTKEIVEEGADINIAIGTSDTQDQLPAATKSTTEIDPSDPDHPVPAHDCGVEYWKSVKCKLRGCFSNRKFVGGALLVTLLMLTFAVTVSFRQRSSSGVIMLKHHNPQHFHLGGPSDGKYKIDASILYSDKCLELPEDLALGGTYSSSFSNATMKLSATRINGELQFAPSSDPNAMLEFLAHDVRTFSGWRIKQASRIELPFEDALSPPQEAIVEGMNLAVRFSPPNQGWQISPPSNTLVDLSSFNARVLSNQPGCYPLGKDSRKDGVSLASGDYITNELCNRTALGGGNGLDEKQNHRVRIFVQDEPSLPTGITLDHCSVGSMTNKPADFQIWYNGTGTVRLKGPSHICCIIYAPHATLEIGPGVLFEGAAVSKNVRLTGGLLFFDKDLLKITDWR